MSHILLAHAPEEEDRASLVAAKLAGLGFEVRQDGDGYRALSPIQRRKLAASVSAAACVVVLWSRDAIDAPALQAAAQAAKAQGKLALARMDASSPPNRMSGPEVANLTQWQGMDGARGWRDLVEAVTLKIKPSAKTTTSAASRKPAASRSEPTTGAPTGRDAIYAAEAQKTGKGLWIGLIIFLLAAVRRGRLRVCVSEPYDALI